MGLFFQRQEIETPAGVRRVLLVEPDGPVVISKARMAAMRDGETGSVVDDAIVAAASEGDGVNAVVFRARSDQPGDVWAFADDIGGEAAIELAQLFLNEHLAVFRRLADRGVVALIGVEFGEREADAYARAFERMTRSLQDRLATTKDESEAEQLRFSLWFAEQQATWSTTPWKIFVESELGERIARAEQQIQTFKRIEGALQS